MSQSCFFPGCPQRCLFRNDDVEAHLVGVTPDGGGVEACFSCRATLLVTFGRTCLRLGGKLLELATGQQCEVPPRCPVRLLAGQEADVMLLLKRGHESLFESS